MLDSGKNGQNSQYFVLIVDQIVLHFSLGEIFLSMCLNTQVEHQMCVHPQRKIVPKLCLSSF